MSAVVRAIRADLPAPVQQPETARWDRATDKQRTKALACGVFAKAVDRLRDSGVAVAVACDLLAASVADATADVALLSAAGKAGRKGAPPSADSIKRWYYAWASGGHEALLPEYKGSERKSYDWEARALHFYSLGSKPCMATVAKWLVDDGHTTATESRVRRYLKSLPADAAERGRLGARLFANTRKSYRRRVTSSIPVGFIYQGDGHTADVYLAHPETGRIWRPELTAWMDVTSRYIPGWYVSEAESSISTLLALSHALVGQNHVPAMLHIDNGSGYASKMMSDESLGFYQHMDIEPMFALPYNAKAKGQVERWFGTMERDYGKRCETYCGADMAPELLQRIVREVNSGKRTLPSLQEYMSGLAAWIERYHNTPHAALDGRSPADVWANLERVTLESPATAVIRPRAERIVERQAIRLHNREYMHAELIQWNGRKVIVEYDIHTDAEVRVLEVSTQRWICDARLVNKVDYLPASRIQEGRLRRLEGQRKRLQRHLDEAEARAGLAITHEQTLEDIKILSGVEHSALEEKEKDTWFADPAPFADQRAEDDALNIYSTDY